MRALQSSTGLIFLWILSLFVAACARSTEVTLSPPPGPPLPGLAPVRSVEVTLPFTDAPQAHAVARGQLPDDCTRISDVAVEQTGPVFIVTIATVRQGGSCQSSPVDFERAVDLQLAGLPAGDYVVVANGAHDSLTVGHTAVVIAPPESEAPPAAPTPTPASEQPPAAGPTPAPATPAPTETAAAPPIVASELCTDLAAFVEDVTIPDYTAFKQGETFTKKWTVRNEGTCAWEGYSLVFASGDIMSAPPTIPLPAVASSALTEISVDLTAPMRGGTHTSNWQFENAHGQRFGVGADGLGSIWVTITVDFPGVSGAPPPSACGAQSNPAFVNQVLSLINEARARAGLAPLALQAQLSSAAQLHSQDMACNSFLSHTGSNGSTWYIRVSDQGYANYNSTRENIYAAPPDYGGTPQGAMEWWMNSKVHRETILSADISEVGIGYAYRSGSEYGGYYTVVFGRPWGK